MRFTYKRLIISDFSFFIYTTYDHLHLSCTNTILIDFFSRRIWSRKELDSISFWKNKIRDIVVMQIEFAYKILLRKFFLIFILFKYQEYEYIMYLIFGYRCLMFRTIIWNIDQWKRHFSRGNDYFIPRLTQRSHYRILNLGNVQSGPFEDEVENVKMNFSRVYSSSYIICTYLSS